MDFLLGSGILDGSQAVRDSMVQAGTKLVDAHGAERAQVKPLLTLSLLMLGAPGVSYLADDVRCAIALVEATVLLWLCYTPGPDGKQSKWHPTALLSVTIWHAYLLRQLPWHCLCFLTGKMWQTMLPLFESYLESRERRKSADMSEDSYDRVREGAVVFLGTLARHLPKDDPKVRDPAEEGHAKDGREQSISSLLWSF